MKYEHNFDSTQNLIQKMNALHEEIKSAKEDVSNRLSSVEKEKNKKSHSYQIPASSKNEPQDITKQIMNYYLRVEIEHVFF